VLGAVGGAALFAAIAYVVGCFEEKWKDPLFLFLMAFVGAMCGASRVPRALLLRRSRRQPKPLGTSIVCERLEGSWFGRNRRVTVDERRGEVVFEHCHWPRKFWGIRPQKRFTCRLIDILEMHDWRYKNGVSSIVIVTRFGKANVDDTMKGFQEVRAVLARFSKPGSGPVLDNPRNWIVGILILGTALAFGLYWALVP
jgi:hypothetical protein